MAMEPHAMDPLQNGAAPRCVTFAMRNGIIQPERLTVAFDALPIIRIRDAFT